MLNFGIKIYLILRGFSEKFPSFCDGDRSVGDEGLISGQSHSDHCPAWVSNLLSISDCTSGSDGLTRCVASQRHGDHHVPVAGFGLSIHSNGDQTGTMLHHQGCSARRWFLPGNSPPEQSSLGWPHPFHHASPPLVQSVFIGQVSHSQRCQEIMKTMIGPLRCQCCTASNPAANSLPARCKGESLCILNPFHSAQGSPTKETESKVCAKSFKPASKRHSCWGGAGAHPWNREIQGSWSGSLRLMSLGFSHLIRAQNKLIWSGWQVMSKQTWKQTSNYSEIFRVNLTRTNNLLVSKPVKTKRNKQVQGQSVWHSCTQHIQWHFWCPDLNEKFHKLINDWVISKYLLVSQWPFCKAQCHSIQWLFQHLTGDGFPECVRMWHHEQRNVFYQSFGCAVFNHKFWSLACSVLFPGF